MASNRFGQWFTITTWGESHGPAIGVVIDGCPAGLVLSIADIHTALLARAPGQHPLTSPRKEPDMAKLLSGVFEGKTTGAPISIIIENTDADSSKYVATKNLLKPGHANFSYLEKYGCFDYRGGGRASARETACRVAAGAIAEKILLHHNIQLHAALQSVAGIEGNDAQLLAQVAKAKAEGDSVGGIVAFGATGLPAGLGDPVYAKLEAKLAAAMLSIPASKGFEIGSGFAASSMRGSEHNDAFTRGGKTTTNHAGGTLGGISTGMPLAGAVAFKPTSSIARPQQTVDNKDQPQTFELPKGSRHDPCVAIRAVPVVKAMCALVLVDCLLIARAAKL